MDETLTWDDPDIQQVVQEDPNFDTNTTDAAERIATKNVVALEQEEMNKAAAATEGGNANKDMGFIADNPLQAVQEVGTAIVGGGADAIDSAGSFLDLVGDTAQTAINKLTGVQDDVNNPFHKDYQKGAWWDIPDEYVPENKSGLGQIARGLVEFGLLAYVTGGVGSTAGIGRGAVAAKSLYKAKRIAGWGKRGSRLVSFFPKLPYVAAEGAIADLISQSSEYGNIANLVNEYAPWVPFSEALAAKPEDNPWLARIKAVTTGAGVNILGHFIVGYAKGAWKAHRLRVKGLSEVEANAAGNAVIDEEIAKGIARDEIAHNEMAAVESSQGKGISNRNYRLEYNEKWLDYYDLDEYYRLLDGEDASQPYIDRILRNNIGIDPKLYDSQLMNSLVLKDLDDQANRFGTREEDPWFDRFGKSFRQLGEDEVDGLRKPAPFNDPEKFNSSEKSTYTPDVEDPIKPDEKPINPRRRTAKVKRNDAALSKNIRESDVSLKAGDTPSSPSALVTEASLKNMSLGDKDIREYIVEAAEAIADWGVRLQAGMDWKVLKRVAIAQIEEIYKAIDGSEDAAKALKDWLNDPKMKRKRSIDWGEVEGPNGEVIDLGVHAKAEGKLAIQIVIHTLAKQVSAIAAGAVDLPPGISRARQVEQIYDAMEVLLVEHKKISYLSGANLSAHKIKIMDPQGVKKVNIELRNIEKETKRYIDEVRQLAIDGKSDMAHDLMEMHRLSGGIVTTYSHIHEYLNALVRKRGFLYDKNVGGSKVNSRITTELRSAYYNSILSNLKTPVKANFSTLIIGMLRPYQAWLGAKLGGNVEEVAIAAAQIDAMSQAYAEGIKMWKHNWDQGIKREPQSYIGRFDHEKDIANFKALAPYYKSQATEGEQFMYGFLNNVVDFNASPWMRFSQNAMGAGDAMARTIIGRMQMRMQAARAGIDKGIDPNKLSKWALENEDGFRRNVFSKNKYDMWIVSDDAARLAGDEATMTKALPEGWRFLEQMQQWPLGRLFFPFVRTGYNAIRLSWAHTDMERLTGRYMDIMNWKPEAGDAIPTKYGIRPEDMASEQALIKGRIATGQMAGLMAATLAATGMMTGDYPRDRENRKLWDLNGIKPNSFKIGNVYISYQNMEPFNTILSFVANVFNSADVLGEDQMTEAGEKAMWMFTSIFVEKSMMAGVVDLADMIQIQEGGGQKIGKFFAQQTRNHFPWAGALGGLGSMMDAHKREVVAWHQKFIERDLLVKNAIPPKYDVLSKDRSGVPYQVPIGLFPPLLRIFNGISPIAVTMPEGDPIKEGLLAINFNLPHELTTYKGVPLNSQERSRFQYYMSIGPLRKNLERVMNDKWFESVEEFKKSGLLKSDNIDVKKNRFYRDVHREFVLAKKIAWAQMQKEFPDLNQKVKDRKTQNRLLELGKINYLLQEFPK